MNNQIAKYKSLRTWKPQIGDFIIHHGWLWNRWYGIISDLDRNGRVWIIKDGLPFLLLTTPPDQQEERTIDMPSSKIARSRGGEFAILQGDTWFIND